MQVHWNPKKDFELPKVGECWCYDWGEDIYMRVDPNYMDNEEGILSVNLNTGDLVETKPTNFTEISKVYAKVVIE